MEETTTRKTRHIEVQGMFSREGKGHGAMREPSEGIPVQETTKITFTAGKKIEFAPSTILGLNQTPLTVSVFRVDCENNVQDATAHCTI